MKAVLVEEIERHFATIAATQPQPKHFLEPEGTMPAEEVEPPNLDLIPETLRALVDDLDPLVIASALALASLSPGPAGEAGAVAAIAYDLKHERWFGVGLSAASMVPLFGYIPAVFKVGWLVFLLNRQLNALEATLPQVRESAQAMLLLGNSLGRYYHKIPDVWLARRLRGRLGRIMGLDQKDQPCHPCAPAMSQEEPEVTSNSMTMPE